MLMLACTVVGYSQFQKGNVLMNGAVNFNTGKSKPNSNNTAISSQNTGFGINLNASRFVSDKAFNSFGVYYNVGSSKQNNGTSLMKTNNNGYGVTFGHTRLASLADRFYLTFPFTVNAGMYTENTKSNDIKTRDEQDFNVSLNASIGLMYQTKKRLVFTCTLPALASIDYNTGRTRTYTNGNLANTSKNNNFGIGGSLGNSSLSSISIGVGYLIR